MRVVRYVGNGEVQVVDEPIPTCPEGGLLIRTEACGLCSGELMSWYMDRKVPHVLGHEVAGTVAESDADQFAVGERVFPHHHAPCLHCEECRRGRFVHCSQWRRTKLTPGGMAEYFAVAPENLTDTLSVGDMRAVDAALIEPLACVVKSVNLSGLADTDRAAVIGLGVMGLMHALILPSPVGYELNEGRLAWAHSQGVDTRRPDDASPADVVFVCPGSQAAFDFAMRIAAPGGTIVLFAPMPPGQPLEVPQTAYFRDIAIRHSYSCGPSETREALEWIANGRVRAEQVISDFVGIEDMPTTYQTMKRGEILKPMVVF
jgi:L-iditol 2-dehydrogenase